MNIYYITQTDFNINLDIATWYEMAVELAKCGCKVEIIVPEFDNPPNINSSDVSFVFLPYPRKRFISSVIFQLSLFFYALKSVISGKCDIFLVDPFIVPSLLPLAILRKAGLLKSKFVMDVRSVPVDVFSLTDKLYRARFDLSVYLAKYFFDGITVITEIYREKFAFDYNIKKENMAVWTSGVCPEKFNPNVISSVKKELNIDDKFVVMYHGGISPSRGIMELIDAFEITREHYSDILLLLVGRGSEKEINIRVKEKKLSESVLYVNAVGYDKIPYYIKACDIGILPFPDSIWWRMSSPLKLFEYMAMGKPVILTDIESHRIMGKESESIFLINTNSPADIAEGIKKAYSMRERLPQIGKKGVDFIRKNGTWQAQAKSFLKYMERI